VLNLSEEILIEVLKTIVLISVLFVWVVRYKNIQDEFEQYKLPASLRDFVGILKISFAFMLHSTTDEIIVIGSGGIFLLMCAAIITHLRVKNNLQKMLPALSMLSISLIILLHSL